MELQGQSPGRSTMKESTAKSIVSVSTCLSVDSQEVDLSVCLAVQLPNTDEWPKKIDKKKKNLITRGDKVLNSDVKQTELKPRIYVTATFQKR